MLLFLFFTASSFAQISGYKGKRVIVKTGLDAPILENGFDFETEVTLLRNFAISFTYKQTANKYTQKLKEYYAVYREYPTDKATIKDQSYIITAKFFSDEAYTAPKGFYTYITYASGNASANGNYYIPNYDSSLPFDGEYFEYDVSDIKTSYIEFGGGKQLILMSWIVIDFNFGLNQGKMSSEDSDDNTKMGGLPTYFGPNLGSLVANQSGYSGGFGFSTHFKIGLLLF
ncbi:MAG: hypothetical protein COC01_10170 [Bacteroidetes bacterium]|nr:MAG: hypothetical protein COC01_10170 [Bacteroidota bacterium]